MNLHACLRVDATHDKVWVTFMAENRGERRLWLPRAVAAEPELTAPLFDLRAYPDGPPLAYLGPAARTGAATGELTADDYVELAPHSSHTHTIDITHAYAFAPGEHAYAIRYEGAAAADIRQPRATTPFATPPVVFRHTAP
jgi:hypothetical protein